MAEDCIPCLHAGDEEDMGLTSGSGRSPGGGHGNLLQYSCLENHHEQRNLVGYSGVAKSQMRLNRQSTAEHNMLKNNLKWSTKLFYMLNLFMS